MRLKGLQEKGPVRLAGEGAVVGAFLVAIVTRGDFSAAWQAGIGTGSSADDRPRVPRRQTSPKLGTCACPRTNARLGQCSGMTPERRITRCVKAILGLALFAVLGFSLAGCGGTKKIAGTVSLPLTAVAIPSANAPHTITVVGTTTIPKVKAGTWIKCKGWLGHGVKVPPLGARQTSVEEQPRRTGSRRHRTRCG